MLADAVALHLLIMKKVSSLCLRIIAPIVGAGTINLFTWGANLYIHTHPRVRNLKGISRRANLKSAKPPLP